MENLKKQIEAGLNEEITSFTSNGIIKTLSHNYFIKSGNYSRIYHCEANGLKELAKSKAIHIVRLIAVSENYIITEYIKNHSPSSQFFEKFGNQMAKMHQYLGDFYGFYEDNYIGATPQLNITSDEEKKDWILFYFNKRLLYQFKLAENRGYVSQKLSKSFLKLESKVEEILKDGIEPPTLLHGDLWGGNFLCDEKDQAVLIDPAVYYGNREADLAMTKIFGGFSSSFYKSYQESYPLKEGWEYREGIYKLYHILNHLNLFGTSYLNEAESLIDSYIK